MMRLLILLFAAVCAFGQITDGSISGYVFDPAQKPIANAKIDVVDVRHTVARHTTTDSTGFYRFLALPPAVYTITAAAENFQNVTVDNLRVAVDSSLRIDIHPVLAGKPQAITVNSVVKTVPTESSELGAVLDQASIEGLPLNKRDFLQLALLTPGVLPPVQDSELSTRGNFAMHANGGREEFNDFLLDGVDNNDQDVNRYTLQPPVDAIQEFKIATNNYGAEYGRNAAGQVNVITRSGGNQFHGFLYEYLRNRSLDARNFFDGSEKPEFIRNQFGGGIGGPVIKDRTFLFFNIDGLNAHQSLTRLATVPTTAERAGDLSGLGTTVFDPFTGQPFSGNVIPQNRIAPLAADFFKLFPLPNLPGAAGNYLGQPVLTDTETQFNVRLDHRLTASDQLALRYSYGRKNLFEPFTESSTDVPGFGDYLWDRGHNAMIHELHTFGSSTMNSLIIGFNRPVRKLYAQNYKTDVNKLWGVDYLPSQPLDFGFPAVSVAGFSPVGDVVSLPIDRAANTYQVTDGLSLVRGRHGLKIGGEVRRLQHTGNFDIYSRGQMIFPGFLSGSGISDLLLGLPTVGIQSQINNKQTLRTTATNLYIQDDWKLRPTLTLNLGMRYEYNTPPVDPTNRMSVFDLATQQVEQVGSNGISRSGIRPDRTNFAPRAGFAWTPASNLVVRGGYGIFYDAGFFTETSSLYFNPPYFNIRVFTPTQTSLLSLDNPFPTNGGFAPPPQLSTLSPDLTTAYLQDWNLNVQREFHGFGIASLAYAGSKGTHLARSRDLNQPLPGPGDPGTRAPYPGFSNIFFTESGGNSEFQSLQASFNRPLSHGLRLWATYMLAKSIDDSSAFLRTAADPNFPQNSRDYRAERGLSSFDIHQRATVAGFYRLPGHNWLTRNTETSTIITAQSGQPFTPILSVDNSNTGNTGGSVGSDRPNLIGDPNLSNPSATEWFNTAAFQVPARYTFGNAGRNIVRGPDLVSVDVSLARRFAVTESTAFTVQAEAFNLFNHTNFDLPQLLADQPATFGHVFSAKAPRQIQFALRYTF